MSTKEDKSKDELLKIKTKLVLDFKGEENLEQYWLTTGRRKIDGDMKEKYNISFYYFKKILMTFSWFREKTRTEIEKYHVEAIKATNLARYGVECNWASKDPKLNGMKTTFEKYGFDREHKNEYYANKVHEAAKLKTDTEKQLIKAKRKETCLSKYGYMPGQFGSPEFQQAIIDKYGSLHIPSKLMLYLDGITFDSYPELCFYVYHVLHGKHVERSPIRLEYFFNGKKHFYEPDFRIDGQLYELKGGHLIGDDGWWRNPFIDSPMDCSKAKHLCAIKNNVKILYPDDYDFYLQWAVEHEWLKEMFTRDKLDERSDTARLAEKIKHIGK